MADSCRIVATNNRSVCCWVRAHILRRELCSQNRVNHLLDCEFTHRQKMLTMVADTPQVMTPPSYHQNIFQITKLEKFLEFPLFFFDGKFWITFDAILARTDGWRRLRSNLCHGYLNRRHIIGLIAGFAFWDWRATEDFQGWDGCSALHIETIFWTRMSESYEGW